MTYPLSPGFKEETASLEAALKFTREADTLREKALEVLSKSEGLTADEVAHQVGASVLAIRPRISELKTMGLVHKTGERRPNASGMSANVWAAV